MDARKRSARIRARFREWATSVRRERTAAARPPAEREGEDGQPARRANEPGNPAPTRRHVHTSNAPHKKRCRNADYDPAGDDMGPQPTARK